MRTIELSSNLGQLRESYEELLRAWNEARMFWVDSNAENVEENHLQPIGREVASAFRAIHELNSVLSKAQRECEPWAV